MAIIRRTMENIRRMKPRINRAKIAATTEADIRRHMSEDGEDESDFADFVPVIPPRVLRKKLHMTQTEFARALRIPLATLRNWEQGRVLPDPAAGRPARSPVGTARGEDDLDAPDLTAPTPAATRPSVWAQRRPTPDVMRCSR